MSNNNDRYRFERTEDDLRADARRRGIGRRGALLPYGDDLDGCSEPEGYDGGERHDLDL
jgi:hypothetical protein